MVKRLDGGVNYNTFCRLIEIMRNGSFYMPWFSLREFDNHFPDYDYIKVGLVGYCISIRF